MTIGQRIKQRREELNMSQEELAKRIGYKSRSSINKIELDIYNLKQSKIKTIAEALDTTPAYIMGWDEDEAKLQLIRRECVLAKLIQDKYGLEAVKTVSFYLESNPSEREKLTKLLDGYSKLNRDDRILALGRMLQIVEDMLAQDKYSVKKESKNA